MAETHHKLALFKRAGRGSRQGNFDPKTAPAPGSAEQGEEWLIAYVDLITLLLALFVLLLSFATLNESKFRELAQSLSSVMRGGVPLVRLPVAIETDLPAGGPRAADAEEVARELRDKFAEQGISSLVLVEAVGDKVRLEIRDDVLFPVASAEVSERGAKLLDALAPTLSQGKYWISVEGHTDNVPIATDYFPSNWELSTARASNVVRRLVERKIEPRHLRAIGHADTRPVADNAAPEGRARNRRVNLMLQGGDESPF